MPLAPTLEPPFCNEQDTYARIRQHNRIVGPYLATIHGIRISGMRIRGRPGRSVHCLSVLAAAAFALPCRWECKGS
jgi:hypothetical protein